MKKQQVQMLGMDIVFSFTDGGSRGNPGPGAIGVLLLDKDKNVVLEKGERIGRCTNNQAEYKALIRAVELASKHTNKQLVCTLDSELVVRQAAGSYRVRDSKLKALHSALGEKLKHFENVSFRHVKRSHPLIKRADYLVNKALDSG